MTLGATPDPEVSVYPAFGPGEPGGVNTLLSLDFVENEPKLFFFSAKGHFNRVNPGGVVLGFDDGVPYVSLCCGRNAKRIELKP
jgi:hypothetical protein